MGPTTFYDYKNQAYVLNGVYARCGHPEEMGCDCYGKLHEGEAGCTHQDTDLIEDGNRGGFAHFIRVCRGCKNPMPEEG